MHDHQRTNLPILTWTSKWCFTNCSWNLTRPFHNSPFRSCIFDMMISYSLDIIITILWLHLIICKRRYVADGVDVGLVNICLQKRIEGKCVAHVPWRMSGSLTPSGGENVPCIPGACATHSFTHGPLARYAKLRVRMRRECRERFPRHRR